MKKKKIVNIKAKLSAVIQKGKGQSEILGKNLKDFYKDDSFEKSLDDSLIVLGMLKARNYYDSKKLRDDLVERFGRVTREGRDKRISKKLKHYRNQLIAAQVGGALTGTKYIPSPKGAAIGTGIVTAVALGVTVAIYYRNYKSKNTLILATA